MEEGRVKGVKAEEVGLGGGGGGEGEGPEGG